MEKADCLFCSIATGKIPARKIYEDKDVLAFLDINPRNPGHSLVIPKKHYATIMEMPDKEGAKLFETVKKVAVMLVNGVNADGISVGQSNGKAAGQVVDHVHFHVIPRFSNEGPAGLESMIPAKKLDENSLDAVVKAIKGAKTGYKKLPEKEEDLLLETDEDEGQVNFDF